MGEASCIQHYSWDSGVHGIRIALRYPSLAEDPTGRFIVPFVLIEAVAQIKIILEYIPASVTLIDPNRFLEVFRILLWDTMQPNCQE